MPEGLIWTNADFDHVDTFEETFNVNINVNWWSPQGNVRKGINNSLVFFVTITLGSTTNGVEPLEITHSTVRRKDSLQVKSIVELIQKSWSRRNWRGKEIFEELGIRMIDGEEQSKRTSLFASRLSTTHIEETAIVDCCLDSTMLKSYPLWRSLRLWHCWSLTSSLIQWNLENNGFTRPFSLSSSTYTKKNFWMRLLPKSNTNRFPSESKFITEAPDNWSDAEPADPEHPATHRKPQRSDPTIRWLYWSTMKRYSFPSNTTPVGWCRLISGPFDPFNTTVLP